MTDQKANCPPLNDEQLDNTDACAGSGCDCGIKDDEFPFLGKCCTKSSSLSGTAYQKACPFCSLWTSLPEGVSLSVSYIIECSRYGYGKRIKE